MPKKVVGMEFIRIKLELSAANTFTQVQMPTPVGRSNNTAMLIHMIDIEFDGIDTPADGDLWSIQVTSVSKTAQVNLDDSNVLARFTREFGFVTSGMEVYENTAEKVFAPPIIYAKSQIFVGAITVGQASARAAYIRIGYSLEDIPAQQYLEALVD